MNTKLPPTFPSLSSGQFAVTWAEGETGIILDASGKRLLRPARHEYRVFDSREAVEAYAHRDVTENPRVEVIIYDASGTRLTVVRNVEAHRKLVAARRKPWWRFW